MKYIYTLLILLSFSTHAVTGVSTNLLRLAPSTLPSLCRLGDLRVDTSTNILKICRSNVWAPLFDSSQILLSQDGAVGTPGFGFTSEPSTGIYRVGAGDLGLAVGGIIGIDVLKAGTNVNFGMGQTASGSTGSPLSASYTYNGAANWNFANLSSGSSSSTVFYIGNGPGGGNGITLENQAYNTGSYAGGGILRATNSLSQLNIASENGAGSIRFNVGGSASLANEAMRLTTSALTLNRGWGILNLSGFSTGVITIQTQSAAGTYNFNLPTTAGTAGQVLTSQGGASTAMTWTTPKNVTVTVLSSGTAATYTPPTGVKTLWVRCVGPGGGGGGAVATTASQNAVGGGGGGGGYAEKIISTPAGSYTYTIGTGGTGVAGANGNGGSANTSFTDGASVTLTANAGGGGQNGTAAAGGPVFAAGFSSNGGGASGGDLNVPGAPGVPSMILALAQSAAGGGGGTAITPSQAAYQNLGNSAGSNGTFYGQGGGGAENLISQAARAGGSGANGVCIVSEFN